MSRSNFQFLIDTYDTERLKTLTVWAAFNPYTWKQRPNSEDPRGRTAQEQFIHQCLSEKTMDDKMLGIDCGPVPQRQVTTALLIFQNYYTATSARPLLN